VDNYSRGNYIALIKMSDKNNFRFKFLVDNYSRGNVFAVIKNVQPKNV
jgi:hypothetical protein